MEKKITYIAEDGEEFEDEEECLAYERLLQKVCGVMAFDDDRNLVSSADDVATTAQYYFITDAAEAKKSFDFISDYYGTDIPTELKDGDIFRYDSDRYVWINVIDELSDLGKLVIDISSEAQKQNDVPVDALSTLFYRIMHPNCCGNFFQLAACL